MSNADNAPRTVSAATAVASPMAIAPLPASLPLHAHTLTLAGRSWTIRAVCDQDALLAAADGFAAFPFGLLLWDSAPVLAEALLAHPSGWLAGKRLLEIGAGVGLAGLVARSLGAQVRQTDHIGEALQLCQQNAQANAIEGIELALTDWTQWQDERLYDVIIGADVLYDRIAFAPLLAVFARNLAPDGDILLTDPGRVDTPSFVTQAVDAGWHVTRQRRTVPALAAGGNSSVVVDLLALRRSR